MAAVVRKPPVAEDSLRSTPLPGPGPLSPKQAVALVARSPGGKLCAEKYPDSYKALLELLSSSTAADAGAAREQVAELMSERGHSPGDQAFVLIAIGLQPSLPFEASMGLRQLSPGPSPTLVQQGTGPRKADVYSVPVGERSVRVVAPAQHGAIRSRGYSVAQVAQALANMPAGARAQVREVRLVPTRPPGGDRALAEYDFDHDVVNVYPPPPGRERDVSELVDDLVHEAGHAWSFHAWGREPAASSQWMEWKQARLADARYPSQYGRLQLTDDAAETLFRYWATSGTPEFERWRKVLPARFAMLDREMSSGGWSRRPS
jgi:hypothetical protein